MGKGMSIRLARRQWAVAPLAAALLLVFMATGSAQFLAPQQAQAQNAAPDPLSSLEPGKLALDQLESTLQRDELADDVLSETRGSLEPLRGELREAIETLERRLADVETRLKQIGDPPAAGAPPE